MISAISFDSLPLESAIKIVSGNGSRRIAIFEDPNCGYCKRLERDLAVLKDVTIYTFIYPVLGPDSDTKSRAIWCSKDAMGDWRKLMLDGVAPKPAIATAQLYIESPARYYYAFDGHLNPEGNRLLADV